MEQKVLMKKRGIEDWTEFKDRRFLGWRKPKTKQLFFCIKGMGVWHKGQQKLFSKIGGDDDGEISDLG
jgi:hypothetical protein